MLLCDKIFLFKIIYNITYNFSLKEFTLEINNFRILYTSQNVILLYTNLKTKKMYTYLYITYHVQNKYFKIKYERNFF